VKGSSAYGKAVWRHLCSVKQNLEKDEPKRGPFLRLVKEIAEYIQCAQKKAPSV